MRMFLLLFMTGCWLSDAEITDRYGDAFVDDDSDGDGVITTEIRSIEPAFGTAAGGTEVVVTVDAVGSDPVVRVGGAEATVVSTTPTTIVVQTPSGAPGPVSVVIESPEGDVTSDQDYWYWEDGQGQVGTVGWLSYTHYTGDLVASEELEDEAEAVFQFVEPTLDGTASLWGTAIDTCNTEVDVPDHRAIPWDTLDVQWRTPDSPALSLPFDAEAEQYGGDIDASAWQEDSVYDLLTPQGDADFPYWGFDGLVATPPPFLVLEPDFEQDRLFTERVGADVAQDFELVWGGGSTGDYITVTALRWGLDSSGIRWEVKERVRCLLADDGRFRFPAETWSDWDIGAPIDLYVGRNRVMGGELPHNRAMNDVAGRYVVAGTAWQALFR